MEIYFFKDGEVECILKKLYGMAITIKEEHKKERNIYYSKKVFSKRLIKKSLLHFKKDTKRGNVIYW